MQERLHRAVAPERPSRAETDTRFDEPVARDLVDEPRVEVVDGRDAVAVEVVGDHRRRRGRDPSQCLLDLALERRAPECEPLAADLGRLREDEALGDRAPRELTDVQDGAGAVGKRLVGLEAGELVGAEETAAVRVTEDVESRPHRSQSRSARRRKRRRPGATGARARPNIVGTIAPRPPSPSLEGVIHTAGIAADLGRIRLFLLRRSSPRSPPRRRSGSPDVHPFEPFFAATPRAGVVLRNHPGGTALATLGARTEYGSPQTVGVAESRRQLGRRDQHRVAERRPRLGAAKQLDLRPVAWSIEISLSSRVLVVRKDGEVVRRTSVGIGAASSPTPAGRYLVTDHIDPAEYNTSAYGCCILALSGHQPHPPAGWSTNRDWRLAIHGGAPGAVSAGCVHADDATLRYLMRVTPLGTPVTVSA